MKGKRGLLAICGVLTILVLGAPQSFAGEPAGYTTGTLVRAESCLENCTRIVLQMGEVVYVALQNATFHWQAYSASEFEENGPVEVRIDGSRLFLKRPNGKELKAKIVKRVRVGVNAQPKLESLISERPNSDDPRSNSNPRSRGGRW